MSYPSTWTKVKFGEIAEIVNDRIDNPRESGLADYIGLEHLDTDEIRIKRYGSPEEVEATKFICKKGDIIFGKRRAYLRKLAVTERDAVVSAHSMVLRPKGEKILTRFLPLFMHSSIFWMTAQAISEGSLSPTIKWKTLKSQEFWIPSIPEQIKISEILWSLEENIEKIENLIQITEKLKKELLEVILTKGIDHNKFKKTELGEIPEEWNIQLLGNIAEVNDGSHFSPIFDSTGKHLIATVKDMKDDCFDTGSCKKISEEQYSKLKKEGNIAKKGDVLFSKDGTIGQVFVYREDYEIALLSSIAIITPSEQLLPDYLCEIFKSKIFYDQLEILKSGTAIRRIVLKSLKKFMIPLPKNIGEQKRILNIFKEINSNIKKQKIHLLNIKNLKKKFTNSLLSGELLIPKEVIT